MIFVREMADVDIKASRTYYIRVIRKGSVLNKAMRWVAQRALQLS